MKNARFGRLFFENTLVKGMNIDEVITKLKGIKKKILQMVGKAIEDKNKEASSDIAKIFKDGADFVSEKNLQPLIQSISKYNNK